jgi:hypothetical protein
VNKSEDKSEQKYKSPPVLARQWGVDAKKVLGLIAAGELVAVNLAARVDGRPRWRISDEEVTAFLKRRQSRPAAPAPRPRRRRKISEVKEFF